MFSSLYITRYFSKYRLLCPKCRLANCNARLWTTRGYYATIPPKPRLNNAKETTDHIILTLNSEKKPLNLRQHIGLLQAGDGQILIDDLSISQKFLIVKHITSAESAYYNVLNEQQDSALFYEHQYLFSLLWHIVRSLHADYNKGMLTTHASGDVFGFFCSTLKLYKMILANTDLYENHFNLSNIMIFSGTTIVTCDIHGEIQRDSLPVAHIVLLERIAILMNFVIGDIKKRAIKLEATDIKQLLMTYVELPPRLLNSTFLYREIRGIFSEPRKALIKTISTQVDSLSDVDIINLFPFVYRDVGNKMLLAKFLKRVEEIFSGKIPDMTLESFVMLIKAAGELSFSNHVSKTLEQKLINIRSKMRFPADTLTEGSVFGQKEDGGENSWVVNGTLTEIGYLCTSLPAAINNRKLLQTIDVFFSYILESEQYACERLGENRQLLENPNNLEAFSRVITFLACNKIHKYKSLPYASRVVEGTSWSIINLNDDILFDLCSGSLELRLSQRAVKPLIEMVLKKMPEATPDRIVKVVCGFSNYFNDFKLTSNSAMWVFLRTKKSEEKDIDALRLAANNSLNMLDSRHGNKHIAFRTAIEYAKVIGMTKINDFKDLTTLSKFMFSISSTVSAFTYHDYQIVSRKMMDIMRTKENWHSSVFSQILWSMYMGRFINIEIFELISSQVMNTIHTLPTDHLTLCIFPLIHFFPLDRQLMVLTLDYTKDILLRIGDCNKHHRFFQDIEVQLVRIIWSIIISDVSECDEKFTKDLLWCISNINWDRFLLHCKVQDIRKISQICTMLELDVFRGKSLDVKLTSLFPSRVLDAVEHDNEMSQDINRISVSQDRVRRVLDKLGVLYRSEFTVYRSIIVDFAVSKDKIEFKPDLLIEVDGPHHYIVRHSFNNHSDEDYELIRNRKTATKYRLLSLLGLNVATVPWIEGYRGKLDKFVEDILRDGNVPFG